MGNIRIDLSYSSVNTRTKFELNFVLSKLLHPTAKEIIKRILHECSCFIELIKRVGEKR